MSVHENIVYASAEDGLLDNLVDTGIYGLSACLFRDIGHQADDKGLLEPRLCSTTLFHKVPYLAGRFRTGTSLQLVLHHNKAVECLLLIQPLLDNFKRLLIIRS